MGVGAGATALFFLTVALAWDEAVPTIELEAFEWINGWPDWLSGPGWPLMQLGMVFAPFVVAAVIYLVTRRRTLGIAVAGSGFVVWVLAKAIKEIVARPRPGGLLTDVAYRLDGGPSGLGFVSGHAAVVFAVATVLTPFVKRSWVPVLFGVALFASTLRIYVGAHLPLDIVGGAAFGVVAGSLVHVVGLGRRPSPTRVPSPDDV